MKEIKGQDKILLGFLKETGEAMYIRKPTWDCGWYWSFGYLANPTGSYHLSSYENGRNINMYDAVLQDYELTDNIKNNLWVFCELALSIYQLKASAELFGRGGSHMTENPCKDLIKNTEFADKINRGILPLVLQDFWDLISDTDEGC